MTDKHDIVPRAASVPARQVLHPAVERMLEMNPTPEALERILALQERWEANEARRAYTLALVGLRKDLPPWIPRDKRVDFQGNSGRVQYTHTSLAAAMESVMPALTAHGFSISWTPATAPAQVTVTATLTHAAGHSESASLSAPPDTGGKKSPAQAVASTVTLLQRYTLLSLLGIATADMAEPGDDAPDDVVDTPRNMKALAAILKTGRTREQAEEFVGRPNQDWTAGDLDRLRAWIKNPTNEDATE